MKASRSWVKVATISTSSSSRWISSWTDSKDSGSRSGRPSINGDDKKIAERAACRDLVSFIEGQSRPAIRRPDTSLGRQAYPFLGLFELERYDREDKTRLVEGAKAGKVTNVSDLALNEPPGLHRGARDKHIRRIVPQLAKAARDELINDRLMRCAPQSLAPT